MLGSSAAAKAGKEGWIVAQKAGDFFVMDTLIILAGGRQFELIAVRDHRCVTTGAFHCALQWTHCVIVIIYLLWRNFQSIIMLWMMENGERRGEGRRSGDVGVHRLYDTYYDVCTIILYCTCAHQSWICSFIFVLCTKCLYSNINLWVRPAHFFIFELSTSRH